MSQADERYLTPGELAMRLTEMGIQGMGEERACRKLINAMRSSGAPVVLHRQVRATDAHAWLIANPEWRPFSNRTKNQPGLLVAES